MFNDDKHDKLLNYVGTHYVSLCSFHTISEEVQDTSIDVGPSMALDV